MRPDAENDTRSPWYEPFAPVFQPQSSSDRSVASAATRAELSGTPAAPEPDDTTEALFDCYNG